METQTHFKKINEFEFLIEKNLMIIQYRVK